MDCISKIPYTNYVRENYWKKKKISASMIIISMKLDGTLRMSKPCYHCTKQLSELKCLNLKYIYYSDTDGTITKVKFSQLKKDSSVHISHGYRKGK